MAAKKEINISIGEQVKCAREQAKLTQEQLAECIDVSPQDISDLERGVVGISIPTLKNLCTSLSISSDHILFPKRAQNDATAIMEKLQLLSPKQFGLLSDIINAFILAIAVERKVVDSPKS